MEEDSKSRAFFVEFVSGVSGLAEQEVDNNEDWDYIDLEDYVREACEDGLTSQQEICMVLAEAELSNKSMPYATDVYDALRELAVECLTEEIFQNLQSQGVATDYGTLCREDEEDYDSDLYDDQEDEFDYDPDEDEGEEEDEE